MANAIIPVDIALLKSLFHLPESYELITVRPGRSGVVEFLVASEEIPNTPEQMPRVILHSTMEHHPSDRDFTKMRVRAELIDAQGKTIDMTTH